MKKKGFTTLEEALAECIAGTYPTNTQKLVQNASSFFEKEGHSARCGTGRKAQKM
jgi:hypothetical protein